MPSKLKRLTTKLRAFRFSRVDVFSLIASTIISALFSISAALIDDSSTPFISVLLSFLLYEGFFYLLFRFLFLRLDRLPKGRKAKQVDSKFSIKHFFIFFAIISVCWIPIFLAFYPGIFGFDVDTQLLLEPTAHHPMFHTLILHSIFYLGKALHLSDNGICAMMSIIQMLITGALYAGVCEIVHTFRTKKAHYFLAFFFALFPACSFASISITKDSSYVAFLIFSLALLIRILALKQVRLRDYIILGVSLFIFLLLRNNAPYAFALWIILAFFVRKFSPRFVYITLTSVITLAAAVLTNQYLCSSMHATDPSAASPYSVPLIMMHSVIANHPEEVPAMGEGGLIFDFFERDKMPEDLSYDPICADNSKGLFGRQLRGRRLEFYWTFIKVGLKYPFDYMKTFARLMVSSWYPGAHDYANIYKIYYGETLNRYTQFMPKVQANSKLPWLRDLLDRDWKHEGYKNNFISNLIMSPGTYVCMLIVYIIYLIYSRRMGMMAPALFVLANYLIILLSPCVLIRYMLPVMFSVPLLYVFTFCARTDIIMPVTHTISVKSPAKRFKAGKRKK